MRPAEEPVRRSIDEPPPPRRTGDRWDTPKVVVERTDSWRTSMSPNQGEGARWMRDERSRDGAATSVERRPPAPGGRWGPAGEDRWGPAERERERAAGAGGSAFDRAFDRRAPTGPGFGERGSNWGGRGGGGGFGRGEREEVDPSWLDEEEEVARGVAGRGRGAPSPARTAGPPPGFGAPAPPPGGGRPTAKDIERERQEMQAQWRAEQARKQVRGAAGGSGIAALLPCGVLRALMQAALQTGQEMGRG